jgi:anti-anti-sigma regulatory factor
MLKINMRIEAGVMTFELEGKLAGPWVKELELCWRSAASTQRIYPILVDLSSVTFIDAEGKELLGRIYQEGAQLVATGCLNKCIVEGITQSGLLKEKEA